MQYPDGAAACHVSILGLPEPGASFLQMLSVNHACAQHSALGRVLPQLQYCYLPLYGIDNRQIATQFQIDCHAVGQSTLELTSLVLCHENKAPISQ